jgi:hypothetical protein
LVNAPRRFAISYSFASILEYESARLCVWLSEKTTCTLRSNATYTPTKSHPPEAWGAAFAVGLGRCPVEFRGVRCGLPVNRPELRNLESSPPPVFAECVGDYALIESRTRSQNRSPFCRHRTRKCLRVVKQLARDYENAFPGPSVNRTSGRCSVRPR